MRQTSQHDAPLASLACRVFRHGFFVPDFNRGWDKLVAVLFHGSWTQESQHAVSILESLAHQQQKQEQQEQRRDCSAPTTPAAAAAAAVAAVEPPPPSSWPIPTAPESSLDQGTSAKATTLLPKPQEEEQRVDGLQILLAEANVMSLIDVRLFCRCGCW